MLNYLQKILNDDGEFNEEFKNWIQEVNDKIEADYGLRIDCQCNRPYEDDFYVWIAKVSDVLELYPRIGKVTNKNGWVEPGFANWMIDVILKLGG